MICTKASTWILLAAVLGFLSVALGAFGAHLLQSRLTEKDFSIFQTAVHYQFLHALAILALGVWLSQLSESGKLNELIAMSCTLFAIGVLIFSGSLYLLVISGKRWFGAITPIGGTAFLLGWLWLIRAAVTLRS